MESAQGTGSYPALDSLRTVEFRTTLKGYHVEDVDDYLERAAAEAEALQEQLRQASERLRQAAERIAALEAELRERPTAEEAAQLAQAAVQSVPGADATVEKMLAMASKFVEQTQAEARAEASAVVEQAQEKARAMLRDAEARVRTMTEQGERGLREEVARLEAVRAQLSSEVERISGHLESERTRLRDHLIEMTKWVEEHLHPSAHVVPRGSVPPDDRGNRANDDESDQSARQQAPAPASPAPLTPPVAPAQGTTMAAQQSNGGLVGTNGDYPDAEQQPSSVEPQAVDPGAGVPGSAPPSTPYVDWPESNSDKRIV